jgi:hypothetical protein
LVEGIRPGAQQPVLQLVGQQVHSAEEGLLSMLFILAKNSRSIGCVCCAFNNWSLADLPQNAMLGSFFRGAKIVFGGDFVST